MSDTSPAQPAGHVRYLVLLGAIIIQLILGTVYGYSIFWTPLNSEVFPPVITQVDAAALPVDADMSNYRVVADDTAKEVQIATQQNYLKYAFSICILSFALAMVIAGRVQDVKGPRFPAIVGAILLGLGFIIASFMSSSIVLYIAHAAFAGALVLVLLALAHALLGKIDRDQMPLVRYVPHAISTSVIVAAVVLGMQYVGQQGEFDQLFVLWGTVGFLAGAGIGFAYVCPIAALVKWFPRSKGLVSGLAVAGFGFGAYLFKLEMGARGYIAEHGITDFFFVHGFVCLVVVIIGAMLLRNPPTAAPAPGSAKSADSNWQDTVKRPAFYVLWLMFFSGAMAGLMVIGIVALFVKEQVADAGMSLEEAAAVGATAMGVLAILNAVGRIAWGLISDFIGRTAAFTVMFLFQAVVLFVLGGLTGEYTLYIAAALIGFNFGGNFALFPSATADLFGSKNLGANYGWVFTSYGIAGVVGIAAGNLAKVQTGSYTAAFTVAAVLCILSAVLAIGLGISRKRAALATA